MKRKSNLQSNSGITLITLVITIIILLILSTVAVYSGIEVIQNTSYTKFVAELKIMHTHVNKWYEDCKTNIDGETFDGNISSKLPALYASKVTAGSKGEETLQKLGLSTADYYLVEEEQKNALGIEGVSQSVLVNVKKRDVVSLYGLNYKDKMYYTLKQIGNDFKVNFYNVDYSNPNTNAPQITVTGKSVYYGNTAKNAKYKFKVDITQGSDYVNKGELYYGKVENGSVTNWKKTADDNVLVDREGTYRFYYKDAADNVSNEVEYVIEPKATLIDGANFNAKMKELSGTANPSAISDNSSITEFKISDVKPDNTILVDNNKVSTNDSQYPVYMWFDNGVINLWSEENWFYYSSEASNMYRQLLELRKIDNLYQFDTSKVSTMQAFFYNDSKLVDIDLNSFDTSNVNNVNDMFNNCSNLEKIYVSDDFKVDSIVDINNSYAMFGNCTSLVGGAGTTYNSLQTNATYAHIDEGQSNPGYFTRKK